MFLFLLLLWLVFNGRFTVEIFLVGAAASGALTFMWHKLFRIRCCMLLPSPGKVLRGLRYFGALVLEIIRCNLQVIRLILHPGEEIRPQLVTFRTGLKTDAHKVVLANSITLTPGTITVGLEKDQLLVHGLDASFLEGIESCDLAKRLEKMEEADNRD